jgi:antitoxin HicB
MLEYLALLEPAAEGGFVVTFPDFEWGVTQGDSEQQALTMARDALAMVIQDYINKGKPLPVPRKHRGRKYRPVRLPAMQAAKTELYREFLASHLRKAELARRLGISKGNVDRLFNLNHHTRLDQIEAAFYTMGKTLAIEVKNAA